MKRIIPLIVLLAIVRVGWSQTATDGLMMPARNYCTGFMFSQDKWNEYWEGSLRRNNGNIGSITTQAVTYTGNYGISDRTNAIVMLPFISTRAGAGTMQPMSGIQDLSLALKHQLMVTGSDSTDRFRVFAVASGSIPISDYTPDYLPLSIGLQSKTLQGRLTFNYTHRSGFYANVSGGYTVRGNVTLDRPSYYTDGQLYLTNEVRMPSVADVYAGVGYIRNGLETKVSWIRQSTLGGGDIRRQDMPFCSNRMDFSRVEALVMYYLPKARRVALRASVTQTVAGRNVGASTTILGGVLYTFRFNAKEFCKVPEAGH